jgi:hypothetical protein
MRHRLRSTGTGCRYEQKAYDEPRFAKAYTTNTAPQDTRFFSSSDSMTLKRGG